MYSDQLLNARHTLIYLITIRPPGGLSVGTFFDPQLSVAQLSVVKNVITVNCVILGDFNLDANI